MHPANVAVLQAASATGAPTTITWIATRIGPGILMHKSQSFMNR